MDIADFFHLQAAFQTDRIIYSSSYKESIFYIGLFGCKPLDSFFVLQNLVDLIGSV